MDDLIIPPIFPHNIRAFFTTRHRHPFVNQTHIPVYKPVQRHTSNVIVLDNLERIIGDAVITDRKGITIGVETADCVPILLCDPEVPAIGAVHAGWRGTAAGILKNTVQKMKELYSSEPPRILMAIGPSIGPCCYEVDEPVMKAVSQVTGTHYTSRNGKYYINLQQENLLQALSEGLRRDNIWLSDECTFCNPHKFHSYRYSRDRAGRQGGFIMIEF